MVTVYRHELFPMNIHSWNARICRKYSRYEHDSWPEPKKEMFWKSDTHLWKLVHVIQRDAWEEETRGSTNAMNQGRREDGQTQRNGNWSKKKGEGEYNFQ